MDDFFFELRYRKKASRRSFLHNRFLLREIPVFSRSSLSVISLLIDRSREIDPDYKAPNFAEFSMVACRHEEVDLVRQELSVREDVEVLREYELSIQDRDDEEFNCRGLKQEYLGRSPIGVDAEYCWPLPGGAGQGIKAADVERGWVLNHPDLQGLQICNAPGGVAKKDPHGLGVLGILAAPNNGVGVTGVAHSIDCVVLSPSFRIELGCESIADAMVAAAGELSVGDILLIEYAANRGRDQLPIEIVPSVFETMRLLTAAGISVIEPAGNGSDPVPSMNDSGAIMVGAVDPIFSPQDPYSVSEFSNFGGRVDCYAWGRCVRTTTLDRYTYFKPGTSAASPIVAGAAAVLQGVSKALGKPVILPGRMRMLLGEIGEPVRKGIRYERGRVPNLRAIIEKKFF